MSRYSSSSSAPSLPQTQAVAHDVVGRRTPTEESSTPASALNVDDLPEPVAPASATTVWSAVRPSRVATRVGGRLGLVDDTVVEASAGSLAGLPETLDPVTEIRAPRHEALGPFQQRRHLLPLNAPIDGRTRA